MKKLWLRCCSGFLAVVMLINLLPANVFAEEMEASESGIVDTANGQEDDVFVVGEVVENRTEFSKEFALSNGLRMAAIYSDAVHYEEDGQWAEIDNTLRLSNNRSGDMYTNTAGRWQVSFPKSLSENTGVTITKDGHTLSFRMVGELYSDAVISSEANIEMEEANIEREEGELTCDGANVSYEAATVPSEEYLGEIIANAWVEPVSEANAQIIAVDLEDEKRDAEFEEIVVEKIYSRLRYDDVYDNTDIVYDMVSNQVKESIVMNQYSPGLCGYSHLLDVGSMVPVLTESGEIQLYDETGRTLVMVMPAPYLVDTAGEYCYDVTVGLRQDGESYVLSYILPQTWLTEEERQWPVVLDPIVKANTTQANIQDVSVYENGSSITHTSGVLDVGHNEKYGIMRAFLKYLDLPALTSADVVVKATVTLCTANPYTTSRVIEAHKVLNVWSQTDISWENHPDFDETAEDYIVASAADYYTWDITDIVRGWYDGENTGLMFKAVSSIENTTSTDSYRTQFYSEDYSYYPTYLPTLYIYFRNNNGLESYWDYTSSSAGRAGTGYINNYTGNLVWVHSDIGFGGSRMPVSISHVYNANDSGEKSFGMGYGWRTNFNQLVYQWSENTNYYVWEDSDGTSHYFLKESDGVYKDEDGLELTLTTTGSGTSKYSITDKYGNASYFDTYGRLTKQENNQATKSSITISYTTTDGYLISKITDGVGRVYNFTYSSNLLTRISYVGSGSTELSYVKFGYGSSKLLSITDKDGEKVEFTYASNTADTTKNLIATAVDVDGYKLAYTYTSSAAGKPARVASVKEYSGSTLGGSLSIEYAQYQTTFTDNNGNVQIM